MDREGGSNGGSLCYYSVLGIRKGASSSDVRTAYRKLAMKWHPDRWTRNPGVAGEAKRRFQQIQEAYSVLSDQSKRSMYDAGLYDLMEDEDEWTSGSGPKGTTSYSLMHLVLSADFCDFMQEMLSMMNNVKNEGDSFEDLQRMFAEMVGGEGMMMGLDMNEDQTASKKARVTASKTHAAKRGTSRC